MDSTARSTAHQWFIIRIGKLRSKVIGEPVSPSKIYTLGYWCIGLCIPTILFNNILGPSLSRDLALGFFYCTVAIWAVAFLIEASSRAIKVIENKYFLAILGLTSIGVIKISAIWAGRIVNTITGTDPSELPDAVAALQLVLVPISWTYVAIVLLTLSLFSLLTFGPLWSMMLHSRKQAMDFFARLVVTATITTLALTSSDYLRKESLTSGKFLILSAEYFEDSRCKNLEPGDIVARIESGLSIYSTKHDKFRFSTCEY